MSYITFESLTADQIGILKDVTKTAAEIQKIVGCGIATITRWRKRLNAQPKRGSKSNKPRPWQNKKSTVRCCNCNREVQVVLSRVESFKYCSRKCMYTSSEYIAKLKNMDKSYMKTDDYRSSKRRLDTPEYRKYKNRVATLTKYVYEQNKDIINPKNLKRTIAGVDGGYHLDHIVSCREGFERGIPPEIISSVDNLQMLPWRENIMKGRK